MLLGHNDDATAYYATACGRRCEIALTAVPTLVCRVGYLCPEPHCEPEHNEPPENERAPERQVPPMRLIL